MVKGTYSLVHRVISSIFVILLAESSIVSAEDKLTAGIIADEHALLIDGYLDDWVYQAHPHISQLTQSSPEPGAYHEFETSIWIFVSGRNLIIGIRCYDPEPELIKSSTAVRDSAKIPGDDSIGLIFGASGVQKEGYFLFVNAAGGMVDGLVRNGTSSTAYDADVVSRTSRSESGWSAEVSIDLRSLKGAGAGTWDFNATRYVPRKGMLMNWVGHTLDSSPLDLKRSGRLRVQEVKMVSSSWRVVPYARADSNNSLHSWSSKTGLDASFKVSSNVEASISVNTDFADIEADDLQLNLSRFSIFTEEKRQFFSEDLARFQFADGLQVGSPTVFLPFYSRRIGLDAAGFPVDINFASKISGSIGNASLSVLSVESDNTSGESDILTAGRARYSMNDSLSAGALLTLGRPESNIEDKFLGVDANWATSKLFGGKNLAGGVWVGFNENELTDGVAHGWGISTRYPNDGVFGEFGFHRFGTGFNPGLSYLERPETDQLNAAIGLGVRPEVGPLRRLSGTARMYSVDDASGAKQSSIYSLIPISLEFKSGWFVQMRTAKTEERLTRLFALNEDVQFAAGEYKNSEYEFSFSSPSQLTTVVRGAYLYGGFFSGDLAVASVSMTRSLFNGSASVGGGYLGATVSKDSRTFRQEIVRIDFSAQVYNRINVDFQHQKLVQNSLEAFKLRVRWDIDRRTSVLAVLNQGLGLDDFAVNGEFIQREGKVISLKVSRAFVF